MSNSTKVDDTISVITSDTANLVTNEEEASTSHYIQLNKSSDIQVTHGLCKF